MRKKPKPPANCNDCVWWLPDVGPRFPGHCTAAIEIVAQCVDWADRDIKKLSCNKKE